MGWFRRLCRIIYRNEVTSKANLRRLSDAERKRMDEDWMKAIK